MSQDRQISGWRWLARGVVITIPIIILSLPSGCALYFAVALYPHWNNEVLLLWIVCLAVSGGGIALLWIVLRRRWKPIGRQRDGP